MPVWCGHKRRRGDIKDAGLLMQRQMGWSLSDKNKAGVTSRHTERLHSHHNHHTNSLSDVGLMLVHRRRRLTNIKPTSDQRLVFSASSKFLCSRQQCLTIKVNHRLALLKNRLSRMHHLKSTFNIYLAQVAGITTKAHYGVLMTHIVAHITPAVNLWLA